MPVILNTPVERPVPTYDKVHMDSLIISIERTDYAKAALKMRLRLYTGADGGTKEFDTAYKDIEIPDVEKWVMDHIQNGDMRGAAAMQNIKEIVALMVETESPWGNAVVS
jgi:hypothetical protein